MPGIPDTLIELHGSAPEPDEIGQVEREICALYPPESARPNFHLTDVVERDGRKFVRLATMAGSMHFMLRRGVKLKTFGRPLLCAPDKDLPKYEYVC